jgi:hypothetical protein
METKSNQANKAYNSKYAQRDTVETKGLQHPFKKQTLGLEMWLKR